MKQDRKWLQLVFEQLPAVLWTTDRALRFTASAGAGLARLGLVSNQVVGMSLEEFFQADPQQKETVIGLHHRALRGETVTFDQQWAGLHYRSRVDPLMDERGDIVGCIGVAQDMTDRVELEKKLRQTQSELERYIAERSHHLKEANTSLEMERGQRQETEVALQESELLFRTISEQLPEALYLFDPDDPDVPGKILHVNSVAARDRGWSIQELIGSSVLDLADDETAKKAPNYFKRVQADEVVRFEGRHRRKDGGSFPVEITASRIRYRNRDAIVGLARDISAQQESRRVLEAEIAEREQVAAALREQTDILRSVLDSTAEGVVVSDENGKLLIWNAAAARLVGLGITDAPVAQWSETYHFYQPDGRTMYPPEQLPLARAIRGQSVDEASVLVRRPGEDDLRYLSVNARPIVDAAGRNRGGVVVFRDVTDIRKAEERVHQREAEMTHMGRLSTLGEMASGLAHELNQPLSAISNYVQGCRQRLDAESFDRAQLDTALADCARQAQRAGAIIKRVRSFARKPEPSRTTTSINEVVSDIAGFLEADARQQRVALQLELAEDLPALHVDPVQIEQVMINLIRNAIEAMSAIAEDRRRLVITTANGREEVIVEVRDFGPGLNKKSQAHMFEPFFTTKAAGLGMGLKISQSIVAAHRGRLEAENCSGGGCVFRVILPFGVQI